jgi:pantothenate kinase
VGEDGGNWVNLLQREPESFGISLLIWMMMAVKVEVEDKTWDLFSAAASRDWAIDINKRTDQDRVVVVDGRNLFQKRSGQAGRRQEDDTRCLQLGTAHSPDHRGWKDGCSKS